MMTPTSGKGNLSWHALPAAQVIEKLRTNQEAGLAPGEVSERLKKYGPNRLPTGAKRGPLMRFLAQINNVLIYVLLGAALGKVFLGEWLDASVILGVVIINALLGFIQERPRKRWIRSAICFLPKPWPCVRGTHA
jgi:magnesium-transporting ATPase (P-type)